jgi:hypothetical protein
MLVRNGVICLLLSIGSCRSAGRGSTAASRDAAVELDGWPSLPGAIHPADVEAWAGFRRHQGRPGARVVASVSTAAVARVSGSSRASPSPQPPRPPLASSDRRSGSVAPLPSGAASESRPVRPDHRAHRDRLRGQEDVARREVDYCLALSGGTLKRPVPARG